MRADYDPRAIEAAHGWIVRALDALGEAEALAESGRTRAGAYDRLGHAAHSAAVALLRLGGSSVSKPAAVRAELRRSWVKRRGLLSAGHVGLLDQLAQARVSLGRGEFAPTDARTVRRQVAAVRRFVTRAARLVPPLSISRVLKSIAESNPEVKDLSFDVYCPRSYYHHTRMTFWCPRGRVSDAWLARLLKSSVQTLKSLGVREALDYVLGLNSRVNQYAAKHLIMLDFDDTSTVPVEAFAREPGFLFRTGSGYHFLGAKLYDLVEWKRRMKAYGKLASPQHVDLSMKRGYATLRLTASPRKPIAPRFAGRTGEGPRKGAGKRNVKVGAVKKNAVKGAVRGAVKGAVKKTIDSMAGKRGARNQAKKGRG